MMMNKIWLQYSSALLGGSMQMTLVILEVKQGQLWNLSALEIPEEVRGQWQATLWPCRGNGMDAWNQSKLNGGS